MSEPAVEGTSGDGEKKEKKNESSYEYGSCCPHVAQYGPYTVEGLESGKTLKWCTCGLSKTQPWCDGSHKPSPFRSYKWKVPDKPQKLYTLCGCKHTKNPPFCDGTHVNLPAVVEERQKKCKSAHEEITKICTGCGWIPSW